MGKMIDRAGQRFGRLVAIRPTEKRSGSAIVWECKCDCGNTAFVASSDLKRGHTRSCGCSLDRDLAGQRFGKLIAVHPTEKRSDSAIVWECKCDCGKTVFVASSSLKRGHTRSCGCSRGRDLAGLRFGKLIAIRPTEKRSGSSVVWECKCDCGNTTWVSATYLTQGYTRSCGCGRKNDLSGQRCGRLMAIRPTEMRTNGSVVWECKCDCGNTAFVASANLKQGNIRSCGCLRNDSGQKRMKDLTGQRFGKLIAIRPTEKRSGSFVVWECRCDCGNTAFVASSCLRQDQTRSCGCLIKERGQKQVKDLTGQRFGRLVAVRPTEKRSGSAVVWECKCDCGKTAFVSAHNLKRGNTQSCGCSRGEDLAGQRFGKLVAVCPTEKRSGGSVVWECHCDCGETAFVSVSSLKQGTTRSCGCLRKSKKRDC